MSRTSETIKQSLINKLPPGFSLSKRGGVLDALYGGFASSFFDGEKAAEDILEEINPRLSNYFLEDFERVLGADPCGRDRGDQTIDQRQRYAHQRWTATGGQSIAYFTSIAKSLGFDIEIEEFWPSICGEFAMGNTLIPEGEQFVWRITLKLINQTYFIVGANRTFDRLSDFEISDLECVLRRLKPAHTTLIFSYQE